VRPGTEPSSVSLVSLSHVRYLTELVALEAADRADRRMTRLLKDAKLPREKTVATLDLNRYAAPLRGQIRQLLRGEFLAGATDVCLIGHPGTGRSHVMAALSRALWNTVIRFSSPLRGRRRFITGGAFNFSLGS
jgi:DNA replication protein DnaC